MHQMAVERRLLNPGCFKLECFEKYNCFNVCHIFFFVGFFFLFLSTNQLIAYSHFSTPIFGCFTVASIEGDSILFNFWCNIEGQISFGVISHVKRNFDCFLIPDHGNINSVANFTRMSKFFKLTCW